MGSMQTKPKPTSHTKGLIRINAYAEQITKTDSSASMQNPGFGSNTSPAGTPVGNATFLIQAKAA